MWEDFFIVRIKPEGALKVENGGETLFEEGVRNQAQGEDRQ